MPFNLTFTVHDTRLFVMKEGAHIIKSEMIMLSLWHTCGSYWSRHKRLKTLSICCTYPCCHTFLAFELTSTLICCSWLDTSTSKDEFCVRWWRHGHYNALEFGHGTCGCGLFHFYSKLLERERPFLQTLAVIEEVIAKPYFGSQGAATIVSISSTNVAFLEWF